MAVAALPCFACGDPVRVVAVDRALLVCECFTCGHDGRVLLAVRTESSSFPLAVSVLPIETIPMNFVIILIMATFANGADLFLAANRIRLTISRKVLDGDLVSFGHPLHGTTVCKLALPLIAILTLLLPNQVCAELITFLDSDFANNDWDTSVIVYSGPQPATVVAERSAVSGNPGSYRQLSHRWSGIGVIRTAHIFKEATYSPAVQGEIDSIDFKFDLVLLDGGSSNVVNYAGAIIQDGNVYETSVKPIGEPIAGGPNLGTWTPMSLSNQSQSDFTKVFGVGAVEPNFSSSGGIIQIAYTAQNGRSFPGMTETISGIDNFAANVTSSTAVPEPAGLLPIMVAALVFFLLRRKRLGKLLSNDFPSCLRFSKITTS